MDVDAPSALLGGLTPQRFMRRHWQRRPLLVRGAFEPRLPLERAALFALAARDDVESRLVAHEGTRWTLRHGPLPRRALPPLAQRRWTLLVQGVDLHVEAARSLLERFRFLPDARLDDLMISWASDGGGVGPHEDAYDVFLLQLHGRRRWRVAPPGDATPKPGLPLKILARFEPQHEWMLEPGDLLYLPPRWGHDGVAVGECMTASVGFRVPSRDALARDVLQGVVDDLADVQADVQAGVQAEAAPLYRDPGQSASATPARVPAALQDFARRAVARALAERDAVERALGAALSEPKPQVWFDAGATLPMGAGVRLDRRTRMLYDERHVFLNGEAYRAGGRDATMMRRLADTRSLAAADVARLSDDARGLLDEWARTGWLHGGWKA